ncbi:MAG: hypothetical protein HZB16_20850 [Armatimonadetes bacterium]|nr:hypothetical protein [Armatimonadota bacterium]
MRRWIAWIAASLCVLSLCGCSALGLIDIIDTGSNDGNTAAIVTALSDNWTVTSYTGTETGSVTVPSAATMRWRLRTDGTFAVTSSLPVSIGTDATHTYDEAGTWRVISGATGTLGFTFKRLDGATVATADQHEMVVMYSRPDTHQLVLITDGIGPGSVRYVLYR